MYTPEQLKNVFRRIGLRYDPDAAPTAELASDVQYAMATHVPYENLDILRGIPLSLDYGDLYDKIVVRHRGGYCFELNGFLGEVLRSLGFKVSELMARYLRGEVEIPMRRHRVVIAEAADGSRWICDAGSDRRRSSVPFPSRKARKPPSAAKPTGWGGSPSSAG